MKLGDFFRNAPHARPVNVRPVKFTAVSRSSILPGGTSNPNGRSIAATITGCFVFLGGDGQEDARIATRRALHERCADPKTGFVGAMDQGDFNIELTYQMLARVLHEYDEKTREAGEPLFANTNILREIVVFTEADRILSEYYKYEKDEHPEVLDTETFRESGVRSA